MSGRARPPIPFDRLIRLLVLVVVVVLGFRLLAEAVRSDDATPSPSQAAAAPASKPPRVRPLPPCETGDRRARETDYEAWASTLVDTEYALPASYVPPDLVGVGQAGFEEPYLIRKVVIEDLTALFEAAEAADNPVALAAAYRSHATQDSLFHQRAKDQGGILARAKTARAGHSEHQLGTALDFKTRGDLDVDAAWEGTPAGKWMAANAWKYGFVMSYPAGTLDETCYWYEPWHYRYVGKDMAKAIRDSGLTLRAYLWEQQELAK